MNPSPDAGRPATRRKLLGLGLLGLTGGLASYLGWMRLGGAARAVRPEMASLHKAMPVEVENAETPEPAASQPSTLFEREAFLPHVNSEFTIIHEGHDSASCRLIEVGEESRTSSGKQTYVSFSLLFEAQPAFLREGGFCKVEHVKMGEMQFFLSPVGKPGRTALLEAVFNLAI